MTDMVVLREDEESSAYRWNTEEIWSKFQGVAGELDYQILGKDYISKMVEFLIETLNSIREMKCTKLDENQRDIGEFLMCDMCTDLYVEPVTLLCGHSYCKKCVQKRETQLYVELCVKCDKNNLKRARWANFFRRSIVDKCRSNVIVNAIVKDNYPNELKAINIRLEGNELFVNKDYTEAESKYQEAVTICKSSFSYFVAFLFSTKFSKFVLLRK